MLDKNKIYEEVISQSQDNVNALSNKLKEFDKLYEEIIILKEESSKLPQFFDKSIREISKTAEDYTNKLGEVSHDYLQKNNNLFNQKINELSIKIEESNKEIDRLVQTDFVDLFKNLEAEFLHTTSQELSKELKKIDDKINDFHSQNEEFKNRVHEFKNEINRLEAIDLENHFDKLQKTLSDIFGAINSINTSFLSIIQTLNNVIQSIAEVQKKVEKSEQEIKNELKVKLSELNNQINNNKALLIVKTEILEQQNINIEKSVKLNRKISTIGFGLVVILLIVVLLTSII